MPEIVVSRIMFTHRTTPERTRGFALGGDDTRMHCRAHHN